MTSHACAITFDEPQQLRRRAVELTEPGADDLIVDVSATGISTGTEKLLWMGTMPAFPGLGYPLVPGYEAVGEVVSAGEKCALATGARVFVPGASCYAGEERALFGASASQLVVPEQRVAPIADLGDEEGVLLALSATALHALKRHGVKLSEANPSTIDNPDTLPDLIVGHGVLGRLLARWVVALGHPTPVVWEIDSQRQQGATGYTVVHPDDDDRCDYKSAIDVSGAVDGALDRLIQSLARGATLTLAGFYADPVQFNFPPAFMRELSIQVAAEWQPDDLSDVLAFVHANRLSLDGLVSHRYPSRAAPAAYRQAFIDSTCVKTLLQWSDA